MSKIIFVEGTSGKELSYKERLNLVKKRMDDDHEKWTSENLLINLRMRSEWDFNNHDVITLQTVGEVNEFFMKNVTEACI